MDVQVIDQSGKQTSKLSLSDAVFAQDFNKALVHQAVVAYQAGGRQGSAKQKTRAEVRGGGAKPWRQKGTGRARVGTIRSPIWVGGGRAFAARPQSYKQKMNKKAYRVAMRSIVSELQREERLIFVDTFAAETNKTKDLKARLDGLKLSKVLIITAELDSNLLLASRNIPHVHYETVCHINPVMLIAFDKIIIDSAAVAKLEEKLA